MLATVCSGAVVGVDAYKIEIEVNAGFGDPKILVVGLPDAAVRESKDRVITAISNSGFGFNLGRVTINLAPADIKKEGPNFDLPIAIGFLAAKEELKTPILEHVGMIGELALSGEVRRVRGVLPFTLEMKRLGMRGVIVPADNAEEAGVVDGIDVYPVRTLRQAADFLAGDHTIRPYHVDVSDLGSRAQAGVEDFRDVKGQEYAKRAIEIAVSGGHNLLAIGPPGTGKTMLAKRVATILPEMSLPEALEATKIHSIAGTLDRHAALIAHRPFRSPHHTVSDAGLLGGGTHPVPGEVSLAHHGVLFLDELPEFRRNVLEVLRQPLEDKKVTVSRASATVTFPCDFMLVAAMNPCPCGFFGDPKKECRCSPMHIQRYRTKISGPLLDRIDLHVEVPSVRYQDLSSLEPGADSASIRTRVVRSRSIQLERFAGRDDVYCNAAMKAADVQRECRLDTAAQSMLKGAIADLNFSARAYERILKVARTIADMADSETVQEDHLFEAVQYRTLDRTMWV